jgi:hypothetical protein
MGWWPNLTLYHPIIFAVSFGTQNHVKFGSQPLASLQLSLSNLLFAHIFIGTSILNY